MLESSSAIFSILTSSRPMKMTGFAALLKWQANFQLSIMQFYKSGVYATCQDLASFFEDASQVQRLKLWSDIYDQATLRMAKASLVGLNGTVPVDEIYSWDGPEHIMWRKFIKTTFLFAADYTYRYKTDDKDKIMCFDRWVAMPNHPAFAPLNLENIESVPVKSGGLWDQGRRRKARKQIYTADERLAVGGVLTQIYPRLTCLRMFKAVLIVGLGRHQYSIKQTCFGS